MGFEGWGRGEGIGASQSPPGRRGGEGGGGRRGGSSSSPPPTPPPEEEEESGSGEEEEEEEEEERRRRRRREEDEEEEDEEEDLDLAQVLAYLLRRGQEGAGRGQRGGAEEEEEEPWEGEPPPAPPPDTRVLDAHQLRSQLELLGGRGPGPTPPEGNLPRLLRLREWGRCRHGSFSPGEKSRLGSHFLPNQVCFSDTYPQKAFCGLFSPKGDLFVTACQDQRLRLYQCQGQRLRLLGTARGRDVGWSILDVVFSPDASQCLYSSWSDYIHVYDIYGDGDTHTALDLRPEERRFAVFSLAVGPDGREVLGGANDGCLYVYDRQVQRRVLRVQAHGDDVNAVALGEEGAGGHLLLSGGDDGVCRAWDRRCLGEGRDSPVGLLAGHRDGITFLHPRGDGRYLVSNSKDQTAKLWDLRRPTGPGGLAAARRAVARQSWDYRWQRAPRRAMTATPLPGDSSLMTYRGHAVLHTLLRCRLSPPPAQGGLYLGAGCAYGSVIVYDVLTGRPVRRLTNHGACVRDVCWHPHEGTLASASWDGSVRLWAYREPQEEEEGRDQDELRPLEVVSQ
ncbi:LOW QUALITY PROTEIN: DDB1- and CUL4-associated factor 11 [Melanerpes formicivorus]|uniref:LOW QUALITY PROTEIN: DDB1- and CUL4-associated factor 11 n=1 Tax=Melanerpes formicivorus TaxID=211600 RepID=UPI00358E6F41